MEAELKGIKSEREIYLKGMILLCGRTLYLYNQIYMYGQYKWQTLTFTHGLIMFGRRITTKTLHDSGLYFIYGRHNFLHMAFFYMADAKQQNTLYTTITTLHNDLFFLFSAYHTFFYLIFFLQVI